ncbi:nucleotidyltransferase family protein [Sulfurimonas sp.]|uniref:nucleotidyltransferase family protein n=1 Tax=Sulfurimonas sp. TaxID=2022749 RepID=UPI00262519DC|nr:nucleotidyltransferase family protein [Sulfurimonas sp.]MDD3856365.1 nucleotidyltransferase family protein [Sulfurimonas sp.]
MTLDSIINFLHDHKDELHRDYHVEKIGIFGSYAKHQEKESSDIDFFVEFSQKSYRNLTRLYDYFEKAFGKKIDIITENKNMRPSIRREIQSSIIYG